MHPKVTAGRASRRLIVERPLRGTPGMDGRPSISPQRINQLWRRFKGSGDLQARNLLAEYYWPGVCQDAQQFWRKLADGVCVDDMISAGSIGLLEAMNSFDPARGFKFETFCTRRVRGAMLDELRSMDWAPRLVRRRERKLKDARQTIAARLGHMPDDRELANGLDVTVKERDAIRRDGQATRLVSLSTTPDGDEEANCILSLADPRATAPPEIAQQHELRAVVLGTLSRTEQLVVVLSFYENMTLLEIGLTLGCSESRISQIRTNVLARLRLQLSGREEALRAA